MRYSSSTVFVTGQAKPSKEDAIHSVYQVFSLSLFIDRDTDVIVDLACTTAMDETEEFIRQLLCGQNILSDMNTMLEQIRTRFFALAQKTLMAALKDAQNRYLVAHPQKRPQQ